MRYIFGLFIVLAAAYTVCARFSDASIARLPPPPTPFYTSLPASTTIVARGYGAENVPAESVAFPIALVGDPIPGTWQFADVATIAEGPSVDITQDQVNDAVSQLRKKLGALRIEATTAPAPTVQPHEYGAWMTRPVRGAPPTHAPYPPIVGLITIHAAPSNASQVLAAVANLRVPGASVVRMNLELASNEEDAARARVQSKADARARVDAQRAAALVGGAIRGMTQLPGPDGSYKPFRDRPAEWTRDARYIVTARAAVVNAYSLSPGKPQAPQFAGIMTRVSRTISGSAWQKAAFDLPSDGFTIVTDGTAEARETVPISYAIQITAPGAGTEERARAVLQQLTGEPVSETKDGLGGALLLTQPATPRDQNEVTKRDLLTAWANIHANSRNGIFRFANNCEALRASALESAIALARERARAIASVIGEGPPELRTLDLVSGFDENVTCAPARAFVTAAANDMLRQYDDDAAARVRTSVVVAWRYVPKRRLAPGHSLPAVTPDSQYAEYPVFRYRGRVHEISGVATAMPDAVLYKREGEREPSVEWMAGLNGAAPNDIVASLPPDTFASFISNDQCRGVENRAIVDALSSLSAAPHYISLLTFSSGLFCNDFRSGGNYYRPPRQSDHGRTYDPSSNVTLEVSM